VVADIGDEEPDVAGGRGFETRVRRDDAPLPFDSGEFDIVFSNSVIEHATMPKSKLAMPMSDRAWVREAFAHQEQFAREIQRVGRSYFVQTPHRAFVIESHTWLPLVGYLPHNAMAKVVRLSDRVWVKHCGYVDWNLLGPSEMQRLFPGCSIHVERLLGLPKSLIAYRRAE